MIKDESNAHTEAYLAVKERLMTGAMYKDGTINIAALAQELKLSRTPVREAMFRLLGERLLDYNENGGYRVCLPSHQTLHDLYVWNAQLLLAALHITGEQVLMDALERAGHNGLTQGLSVPRLFQAIGDATGNSEFSKQIMNANDRLAAVRIVEQRALSDTADEAARLVALGRFRVQKNLRRKILAYHRRRISHIPQILNFFGSVGG